MKMINFDTNINDFGKFVQDEVLTETLDGWEQVITENPTLSHSCSACLDIIKKYLKSNTFKNDIINIQNNNIKSETFQQMIGDIIREIIHFDAEYVYIDKIKIYNAMNDISIVPSMVSTYFNDSDLIEFIKQSFLLGYIDDSQYSSLLNNVHNIFNYIDETKFIKLLQLQLTYVPILKRYIPEIQELQSKGLDEHIKLIQSINYETLLASNSNIIAKEIENYLDIKYDNTDFTSNEKIEYIYSRPLDFLKILTITELKSLINRVRYHLDFLTPSKVETLFSLKDSDDITKYLTINEIKKIIDKEVDMKNSIIKALSKEEIIIFFEQLKFDFLNQDLTPLILNIINSLISLTNLEAQNIIKNAIIYAENNKNIIF